jgi:hypothetical protein
MPKRDNGPICDGSNEFPTSFDGEFTTCETCGRKMNLDRDGKVPKHRVIQPKNYVPASTNRLVNDKLVHGSSKRAIDAQIGSWPDE